MVFLVLNKHMLLNKYKGKLTMITKGAVQFILRFKKTGILEKDEEQLLNMSLQLLTDMKILYESNQKTE